MVRPIDLTPQLSRGIVLDLEPSLAEAVVKLGDYALPHEVDSFVAAMFSVMLTSIALDDTSESGDAIDRMIAHYNIPLKQGQHLWGEFLVVLACFYDHYRYHDTLADDLRVHLGRSIFDTDAECQFVVTVKDRGRYLLVR